MTPTKNLPAMTGEVMTGGKAGAGGASIRPHHTTAQPRTQEAIYSSVPAELKTYRQWVAWNLVDDRKRPVNPVTGFYAAVDDPSTWGTFQQAIDRAKRDRLAGVGFVFTELDPYCGVDLDKCIVNGELTNKAQAIVNELCSYSERSQSGLGAHVIVKAKFGPGRKASDVEVYDRGRFFVVTGQALPDCPATIEPRQDELDQLKAVVFGNRKPSQPTRAAQPTNLDDWRILELARNAGNGAKFDRLWSGNASGYGSSSEADLALCAMLGFWVGGDEQRIDAMFRQSGLYRDKWLERHSHDGRTYGQMTIGKALEGLTEFYRPPVCNHDHEPEPVDWEPTPGDWQQCRHCAAWWHRLAHDGRFIAYHRYCGNKSCPVFQKIRTRRYLSPALGWGNVYMVEMDDRDYRSIRDLVDGDYIAAPQPSGRTVLATEKPTPYSVSMPVQLALEALGTAIEAIPADKRIRRRQGKRQRPTGAALPRDKSLDGRLRPGELKIIREALGAVGVKLLPFRAALRSAEPLTTDQTAYVKTVIDALQRQPWGKVSSIDTLPLETHTVPTDAPLPFVPLPEQAAWPDMTETQRRLARLRLHGDTNHASIAREVHRM